MASRSSEQFWALLTQQRLLLSDLLRPASLLVSSPAWLESTQHATGVVPAFDVVLSSSIKKLLSAEGTYDAFDQFSDRCALVGIEDVGNHDKTTLLVGLYESAHMFPKLPTGPTCTSRGGVGVREKPKTK